MADIEKQMEMFEDGGLIDEGGSIDPVSGNDVPVGSTQEEVRDDIPAQLSEGEFVFPADVVRFYGLERLMEMRQRAKAGLQLMDDMGQMGNSEEAIVPDTIPFDVDDLDIDDNEEYTNEMEMAVGGFVPNQQTGVYQAPQTGMMQSLPSQFANYQPQYTAYQAPVVPATQAALPTTYVAPQQQAVPTATVPTTIPSFQDIIPSPEGKYDEIKEYENKETGEKLNIPFVDGKPIFPVPTGYTEVAKDIVEPTETPKPTTPTVRVRESGGDDDDGDITTTTGTTLTLGGETYGEPKGGGIPGTIYAGPTQRTQGTAVNPQMRFQLKYDTGMLPGVMSAIKMATKKDVFTKDDNVKMTPEVAPNKASNVTINMPGLKYNTIRGKTTGDAQQKIVNVSQTLVDTFSSRPKEKFEIGFAAAESLHDNKDNITGGRNVRDPEANQAMQEVAFALSRMNEKEIEDFNRYMSEDAPRVGPPAPVVDRSDRGRDDSPSAPSDSGPQTGANVGSKDFGDFDSSGPSSYSSQATGDRTSGRTGFNEGGLANKKPKPKRTKRGGLASKK